VVTYKCPKGTAVQVQCMICPVDELCNHFNVNKIFWKSFQNFFLFPVNCNDFKMFLKVYNYKENTARVIFGPDMVSCFKVVFEIGGIFSGKPI
jgi:hypothetical protein